VCERSKGESRRRLLNKCTMQYENIEYGTLLRILQMNLSKRIENRGKETMRLREKPALILSNQGIRSAFSSMK
jgi:hypothetical protein